MSPAKLSLDFFHSTGRPAVTLNKKPSPEPPGHPRGPRERRSIIIIIAGRKIQGDRRRTFLRRLHHHRDETTTDRSTTCTPKIPDRQNQATKSHTHGERGSGGVGLRKWVRSIGEGKSRKEPFLWFLVDL